MISLVTFISASYSYMDIDEKSDSAQIKTHINVTLDQSEWLKSKPSLVNGHMSHNPLQQLFKEPLTSVQPSDMRVREMQRTSIPVVSILFPLWSLWRSPPFCLSFYTLQLSVTLLLIITVGRQRELRGKKYSRLCCSSLLTSITDAKRWTDS